MLETVCVPIFRQNGQLWIFGPKFAQKWILGSKFKKSESAFGISVEFLGHNLPKNKILVKMNHFLKFFRLNLRKLHNYVQYFGLNIVEGVAESWVEVEMSWVEVGARFSNTRAISSIGLSSRAYV